jgi:hypothetical protein
MKNGFSSTAKITIYRVFVPVRGGEKSRHLGRTFFAFSLSRGRRDLLSIFGSNLAVVKIRFASTIVFCFAVSCAVHRTITISL